MRALVKSRAEPGLWMEEIERPSIGPNDLLVRVHHTSICGTDLHIWNWDHWAQETVPVPLVIGHEFEGVIAEIGSEVSGFAVRRAGRGRGSRDLRPLPQLSRRPAASLSQHGRASASNAPGRSPSTSRCRP